MSKPCRADGIQVVASHRKARHEYEILDTYEAGLALKGTEVKSLRDGKCNLQAAFGVLEDGSLWIKGMEIPEYSHGNLLNHAPARPRQLLLHKREIHAIAAVIREKGFTVVPLRLYFKDGRAKLEIAVARGRKLHDRREATARKEAEREMARAKGRRGPRRTGR